MIFVSHGSCIIYRKFNVKECLFDQACAFVSLMLQS
jgi:hypothetical protein